jgi:hypothetical protein
VGDKDDPIVIEKSTVDFEVTGYVFIGIEFVNLIVKEQPSANEKEGYNGHADHHGKEKV